MYLPCLESPYSDLQNYFALFILCIFLLFYSPNTQAQNCGNLDFESCDFSGWELFVAKNRTLASDPAQEIFSYANEVPNTDWEMVSVNPLDQGGNGNQPQRFIANGGEITVGFGNQLDTIPMVFPRGGSCSAILGDFYESGANVSVMRRTFTVTNQTDILQLRYAVVLEDPGHDPEHQPFFVLNAFTETGDPLECIQYSAVAGDGQDGWVDIQSGSGRNTITYKPWDEIFVPLKDLIGQNIVVEVVVADCAEGGHAGFAFVDLECGNSGLDVRPINGCEFPYTIVGPVGAESYVWSTGQTSKDIEVNAPGIYSVDVVPLTGANCAVTLETEVTKLDSLPLIIEGKPTICQGDSTELTVSGAATYQWNPATGISDPTSPTPTFSPTVTTTYTVEGIGVDGCVGRAQVTIEVNPSPIVDAGENFGVCEGESAQLNATGAATYQWRPALDINNPNIANPTAQPTIRTTYSVVGTSDKGCSATDTVTVDVSEPLLLLVSADITICEGEETQLAVGGAQDYAWTPAIGLSDPTIADPIASPTETTVYTVTGTVNGACPSTRQITVNVSETNLSAGPDVTICDGSNARLNATGASTYTWSPAIGLSDPNSPNPVVQPTRELNYTLVGINEFGCADTDEITVFISGIFDVDAGEDITICEGDTVPLNAIGGSNYTWVPGVSLSNASLSNPVAFPVSTTTYTVTAEDGSGCFDSAQVTITVNEGVNLNAGEDVEICEGETTTFNASGATIYQWQPEIGLSNPNIANPVVSVGENTIYTVTGTNNNGCEGKDEIVVSVLPVPDIDAGADEAICAGSSVDLQASGGNAYTWSPANLFTDPNEAAPTLKLNETTSLLLTGTNGFGCSNTDSVTITVGTELNPDAGQDIILCAGESAVVEATGGERFNWEPAVGLSDPNIANPVASPSETTVYLLTVEDELGCTGTDRLTVQVNPKPNISAGPDLLVCPGSRARLNATGGANYSWFPAVDLSETTIADPFVFPTTSRTYVVKGIDNNGCTLSDTVEVQLANAFNLDAGEDIAICTGDTTQLIVEGGSSYTWSPFLSLSNSTVANPFANPSVTTTYTVVANDDNGCRDTDSVTVIVYPPVNLELEREMTICEEESVQLSVSGASFYEWTPADDLSATEIADPIASPLEDRIYRVRGTDDNGCSATAKVNVYVTPLPEVFAGLDTAVCFGDTLALDASGADTYLWTTFQELSDSTQRDPLAQIDSEGLMIVAGTRDGCSSNDSFFVSITPGPEVFANDREVCQGDTVQLSAVGGEAFLWSQGDTTSIVAVSPLVDTSYFVTAFSENGCAGLPDSVSVRVVPYPEASFSVSDSFGVVPLEVGFINTTEGGVNFVWDFGDGTFSEVPDPVHTYDTQESFEIIMTAFNELGCTDTAFFKVEVDNFAIYVPNAFTPNGDGKNDFFQIGAYNFESAVVQIFSRDGRLMFESFNKDFRWDGTFNGVSVPEGNYVCKITGRNISGGEMTVSKVVTLIR